MPGLPPVEASTQLPSSAVCGCAAGVYTSAHLLPIVAHAFEAIEPRIPLERLENFVSNNGRAFYGFPAAQDQSVTIRRTATDSKIPTAFKFGDEGYVIPYKAGTDVGWEIAGL